MAPGGGSKRKRPERGQSYDDGSGRPSPHRPENLNMAQERQGGSARGGRGAGRRESRQGQTNTPDNSNGPSSTQQSNASRQIPSQNQAGTPVPDDSTPSATTAKGSSLAVQPVHEPEDEPEQDPLPYAYETLTDEFVASWNDNARQSLVDSCLSADSTTIGLLLQELTRSALDRRVDPREAGSIVQQIKDRQLEDGHDVQFVFLSTLSLLEDEDLKKTALSDFVAATGMDPEAIRADLDIPILQALELVRPSFTQIRTRKTTNVLYRQANFNLLREETEGYAKVMTEYFNAAQESASANDPDMAEAAFQRVKALVGSFDLDVGRVLDITIDISANLLVRAYAFFVKFYRCSSWWPDKPNIDNIKWESDGFRSLPGWADPALGDDFSMNGYEMEDVGRHQAFWERVREHGVDAFFEIGARRIIDYDAVANLLIGDAEPQLDSRGKEVNADRRKRTNEDRRFMRQTKTLPPTGNPDAAQLLGFKLRFYNSEARDAQDHLPDNLIALAAMLIKIGFVSLRDLYPHLSPSDEQMADERARLEKEKAEREAKERPGGGPNALAMAGALTDDTIPAVRNLRSEKERSGGSTPKAEKKEEETKEALPQPDNQKIMLLKTLLLIGAIPEALHILGRFPWLPEVDVTIPPLLNRIARQMLCKIAETVRPMKDRLGLDQPSGLLFDTLPDRNGILSFTDRPRRSANRWLGEDKVDLKAGMSYKFFYAEWADSIPICQTVDDVFLLCDTFLGYLGVKIGQDPEVLGVIARLAKQSLTEDNSTENEARWLDLMKQLLVPALSLSKHNPELTQLIFDLLNFFPMTTRFNVYAEWYLGKTSRLPDMRSAFAFNKAEAKEVLRRVTVTKKEKDKDKVGKKDARALAKISYSSPGIVMMYMINQLENYNNMIPALVECVEPLPALAWDVLTWCLINSLGGQGRGRMQADGMLTSSWLQALSKFVAALYAKYNAMDPMPVLRYLASQLKAGVSTDLEVFEQLLAGMAGIKADVDFNDSQVLHMATGDLIQSTVLKQLGDTRDECRPKAIRLLKALTESDLISQFLIAIAQERQMYMHRDIAVSMPLKVLGNNVDKVQQILTQYLNVLTTGLKPAELANAVPDTLTLIKVFGIEPSIAFVLSRCMIAHRILDHDEAKKLELQEKKRRQSNSTAQENGDVDMKDDVPPPDESAMTAVNDALAQGEDPIEAGTKLARSSQPPPSSSGEEVPWHPALLPLIEGLKDVCPQLAARVSLPFYVRFWTLGQADIFIFNDPYNQETSRLNKLAMQYNPSRLDSSAISKEKERKKKALQDKEATFRGEMTGRVGRYTKLNAELSREKAHWFPNEATNQAQLETIHINLLQECFIPRAMMSALDAHYSFIMLFKHLHDRAVPNFSTVALLNALFQKKQLTALIFQCTALEAQYFGRFLHDIIKQLAGWHKDKAVYEKEALGIGAKSKLLGFSRLFEDGGPTDIGYEEFRRIVFTYHSNLYGALIMCFDSGEYAHVRNGIVLLKFLSQSYPQVNFHGTNLLQLINKMSTEEKRQDLQLMAKSLVPPIKLREKQWVPVPAFRLSDKTSADSPGAQSGSNKTTPKLNASAPEFKPHDQKDKDTVTVEDGEVDETAKQETDINGDVVMKEGVDVKGPKPVKATAAEAPTKRDARDNGVKSTREGVTKSASRTSTPAPTAPRGTAVTNDTHRRESGRHTSTPTARGQSSLPSRPEQPEYRTPVSSKLPPAPPTSRFGERSSSRRDDNYGRLSQPGDFRPGSREHSPGRGRNRSPPPPSRLGPNRDERGPARTSRDDASQANRRSDLAPNGPSRPSNAADGRDRSHHASNQPLQGGQLASAIASAGAGPTGPRSAVVAPSTDERGHHENPDRLAQIERLEIRSSRDGGPASRIDAQRRNDNPTSGGGRGGRGADLMTPTGPRSASGRQRGDMAPPESSYGRLNAPEAPSAPSAPRGAPQGPSNRSGPSGPIARPGDPYRPPESPSTHGSQRSPALDRRQSDSHFASHSTPSTPQSETATVAGVHPSRLARLNVEASTPAQSNPRNGGPPGSPSLPPSGPKGAARAPANAPTGPSPTSSAPPTGPATDRRPTRGDRNGGRSGIAQVNAALETANSSAPSRGSVHNIRGAARQTGPSQATNGSTAVVQTIASPIEAPNARRHDSMSSRPASRTETRPDNAGGSQDMREGDGGRHRRREDDAGDRQRSSRNASRERRPDDGRGRRTGPPTPADEGPVRRPGGERQWRTDGPLPPPQAGRSSGYNQPQWSNPNDDPRRGGRPAGGRGDDYRGPRREDERRSGPPPPPLASSIVPSGPHGPQDNMGDGRKRRYEDPNASDPSKRRRSGRG